MQPRAKKRPSMPSEPFMSIVLVILWIVVQTMVVKTQMPRIASLVEISAI